MNLYPNNMLLMMTTQVKFDCDALPLVESFHFVFFCRFVITTIVSSFRMTAPNNLVLIRQIHSIRGSFPVMLQSMQQSAFKHFNPSVNQTLKRNT